MTAIAPAVQTRQRPLNFGTSPSWVGDPSILVYAARYALTLRGGHVPEFVHQSIEANVGQLTAAARQAIVRDVRTWLNYGPGLDATAQDRAVWIAVLAALGVDQ